MLFTNLIVVSAWGCVPVVLYSERDQKTSPSIYRTHLKYKNSNGSFSCISEHKAVVAYARTIGDLSLGPYLGLHLLQYR